MEPDFEQKAAVEQARRMLTAFRDYMPHIDCVSDLRRALRFVCRTADALEMLCAGFGDETDGSDRRNYIAAPESAE